MLEAQPVLDRGRLSVVGRRGARWLGRDRVAKERRGLRRSSGTAPLQISRFFEEGTLIGDGFGLTYTAWEDVEETLQGVVSSLLADG
ncbi:hypothetical protein V2G26_001338 [Clonostachys chloroleuca]